MMMMNQQQYGMGAMPNPMYFLGHPVQILTDPMEKLKTANGAFIKQKIELFEMLSGCEMPNRYNVYLREGNQYYFVFKCKEKSTWCMRNCCE
jgi:hypothetical protein